MIPLQKHPFETKPEVVQLSPEWAECWPPVCLVAQMAGISFCGANLVLLAVNTGLVC